MRERQTMVSAGGQEVDALKEGDEEGNEVLAYAGAEMGAATTTE